MPTSSGLTALTKLGGRAGSIRFSCFLFYHRSCGDENETAHEMMGGHVVVPRTWIDGGGESIDHGTHSHARTHAHRLRAFLDLEPAQIPAHRTGSGEGFGDAYLG